MNKSLLYKPRLTDPGYLSITFNHDIRVAAALIGLNFSDKDVRNCWQVYANARAHQDSGSHKEDKLMVMGALHQTHRGSVLANLGTTAKKLEESYAKPTIDSAVKDGRIKLDDLSEHHFKTGGILSDVDWNLLMNDAWLLGIVHGGHEVIFTSDTPLDRNSLFIKFWDRVNNRPRVTAREMLGLITFGYTFEKHRQGDVEQYAFVPPLEKTQCDKQKGANFICYVKLMKECSSVEYIFRFFRRLGLNLDPQCKPAPLLKSQSGFTRGQNPENMRSPTAKRRRISLL